MRIKDIITHLFDWHVMVKKNWTLERLVAWVETVEPKNFDPSGNMSPEILERLSQMQIVSRSQDEEDWEDADDWQRRVSAFELRNKSRRGRGVL